MILTWSDSWWQLKFDLFFQTSFHRHSWFRVLSMYSVFPVYWTVLSQVQDVNQTRYWKAMFNITSFCLHSKRLLQIDRNFYVVNIVKDHESLFILWLFKCDSALLTFMFSANASNNHSLILDPLIIIKHFINEI